MKSKVLLPLMLVVFLAGSALATGQDRNAKKIDRIQKKIEKQSKKLQELTGEEAHIYRKIAPPMRAEQIEKIREEAMAQAEKAREQVRESMESQREVMQEQRETMMDQKRELENQMIIIRKKNAEKLDELKELDTDKLKELGETEIQVLSDLNGKKYRYSYKTPKFEFKGSDPIVIDVPEFKFKEGVPTVIDVPGIKGKAFSLYSGSQDNLSIEKTLSDESSTADFNYEVKKGAGGMSVNVNGAIDSGKVNITIKRPDGEVYNEYTLSSLANVNWKQTIKFEDQIESEYLGKWTVTVAAEKAKGTYTVQLNGR